MRWLHCFSPVHSRVHSPFNSPVTWFVIRLGILLATFTPVSGFAKDAKAPSKVDVQILDVRTPEEFAENSLQVAVNLDVTSAKFKDELQKLDKSKTYMLYCRSGKRSALAEKLMRAEGFQRVENLGSLGEAAAKLQLPCRKSPCPAAN